MAHTVDGRIAPASIATGGFVHENQKDLLKTAPHVIEGEL